MDECIERERLLSRFNIDDMMNVNGTLISLCEARETISNFPAADVVTVVRCGDCKYSTLPSVQTQIYGRPGTRTCHNKKSPCNRRNVFSDDFCRYGERKNDADEPDRA